jgi:hypothetical protein
MPIGWESRPSAFTSGSVLSGKAGPLAYTSRSLTKRVLQAFRIRSR